MQDTVPDAVRISNVSGLWPLVAYSLTGEIRRVLAESQRKSVLQRQQKIRAEEEEYRGGRTHTE